MLILLTWWWIKTTHPANRWFLLILTSPPTDTGKISTYALPPMLGWWFNDNFRGYDAAFVLKQISSQAIKDGFTDEFMSDEDINEWLRIYKDNLKDETVSLEELLFEVNLMLPSVALSKIFSISWRQQGMHDQQSPRTDRSELVGDFRNFVGPGLVWFWSFNPWRQQYWSKISDIL